MTIKAIETTDFAIKIPSTLSVGPCQLKRNGHVTLDGKRVTSDFSLEAGDFTLAYSHDDSHFVLTNQIRAKSSSLRYKDDNWWVIQVAPDSSPWLSDWMADLALAPSWRLCWLDNGHNRIPFHELGPIRLEPGDRVVLGAESLYGAFEEARYENVCCRRVEGYAENKLLVSHYCYPTLEVLDRNTGDVYFAVHADGYWGTLSIARIATNSGEEPVRHVRFAPSYANGCFVVIAIVFVAMIIVNVFIAS